MLSHRLYYSLKPYLPWRVRIGVRRVLARHLRRAHQQSWPIDPAAGQAPRNWPGWPEGKKFAFVLTHDVESPAGLDKCRQLAELEMARGFRSTFHLIPEGPYRVPPELRTWLTGHGFEVGVHDLRHDGWLFESKEKFQEQAQQINRYLREWGAKGFRAGFMLRNLDWLQQLDVQYDASTFDTDPFEPQSEGAGTIFPFWIPAKTRAGETATCASQRGGYIELPYTLPQDSTLFLVLKEKSSDIWRRKLDWIAERGGMALVNVHPDYLQFPGEKPSPRTFPVERYLEFLDHARQRYGETFWQPVAGKMAEYARQVVELAPCASPASTAAGTDLASHPLTPPSLRQKRAAVLLYSYYPADPRPRRAAEALVEAGMEVDLICLREHASEPVLEQVAGVNVRRLPMGKTRAGKLSYLWQYGRFIALCFGILGWRSLRRRYDLVHVHNMPDVLVFAALPARLRGAKVVLDLHDPMPELMTSIYGLDGEHWMVKALRTLEQWSIRFANLVLTPNIAFKDLFVSRGAQSEKIEIVMNSPQPEIFAPDRFAGDEVAADDGEFRVMHHGSIVHRHGVDQLVEAVALARAHIPQIRLDIYGSSTAFLNEVLQRAEQLGIKDLVRYHGPKRQTEIADAIRRCHLGVVPNRHSQFTEINFPTRLFEYLAMHRPVLAPSTKGIRDYFKDDEIFMFTPGNVTSLAEKIVEIHGGYSVAAATVARGRAVYRRHLWSGEKHRLQTRIHALLKSNRDRAINGSAASEASAVAGDAA